MSLDWKVNLTETAKKQLIKIDKIQSQRITKYLRRLTTLEDPRETGKALKGQLKIYWRYRVGDYRIICEIQDSELMIIAVEIGHRKEVYK